MRQSERFPDDPEFVATLEAIDATLAGEAVDPRHAELAELALMLAAERPVMPPGLAALLDDRRPWRAGAPGRKGRRRATRWVLWAPATAVVASLAVAIVIVVAQGSGGPRPLTPDGGTAASASSAAGLPNAVGVVHAKSTSAAVRSSGPLLAAPIPLKRVHQAGSGGDNPTYAQASTPSLASGSGGGAGPSTQNTLSQPHGSVPQTLSLSGPPTAGRQVIQGAQLSLSTSARRVDQVAQEVFGVVGQQNGVVKRSSVTANGSHGGYAQFQLSVPSSNLAATMSALSNLSYAQVVSRTDSSQDVTNQYDVDQRTLSDARALRASLLKQLAAAVTTAQIDSLTIRIHDAENAINYDEGNLHSLEHQVGYSQIFVTLNAGSLPVPVQHGGGGFGLGKAAHDAGKVLTVAAGVALIGLAALLPIGLVLLLLWWIYSTVRHRRRLQALDLH